MHAEACGRKWTPFALKLRNGPIHSVSAFSFSLNKYLHLSKPPTSRGKKKSGGKFRRFLVSHFVFCFFWGDFFWSALFSRENIIFLGKKSMEEEEALPDHLRCKRTDGRQWRCTRRVMESKKLCELHYLQGRHRQNKEKVPISLKLQRKKRYKTLNRDSESRSPAIRVKRVEKSAKTAKRRDSVRVSEALDKALKKMKLKKGDLQLELIRVFLQRQVERRKRRRSIQDIEGELVRELPNGLMAISQAPFQQHTDNAGSQTKLDVDLSSDSVPRRCFRSKNIEPLPIGSLQVCFIFSISNSLM